VTEQQRATQIAALPFRKRNGKIEILLITSRETKRWIIPKGWPMAGLKDYNAARREALEEAGVKGRMCKTPVGRFTYDKRLKKGGLKTCQVEVYLLAVETLLRTWAEKDQRSRQWFGVDDAISTLGEVGLRQLIAHNFGNHLLTQIKF
jgi:8-oxo-dGTP pyrophosphatase MutT (NUDIX family)